MNKYLKLLLFVFVLSVQYVAAAQISPDWVMYFQNYVLNRQSNRAVIYNALNLNDNQRIQYREITKFSDDYYKIYFENLICETYELDALKDARASFYEIRKQKREVNSIVRNIKKLAKKEDAELKHILTRKQRTKYSMIKKLERHDLKKEYHAKNYYKENPLMTHFGDPKLER